MSKKKKKKKKGTYRQCEKGSSRLMCSSAQSDKSLFYLLCSITRPKGWHSLCKILAVLLFWVACAADLIAINLCEQNKVCFITVQISSNIKGIIKIADSFDGCSHVNHVVS